MRKFLPSFPRADKITLYHLLTHTSGIADYTAKPDFRTNVTRPITTEALIQSFQDAPHESEPGKKYRYNNSGYVLLGRVIEVASGMRYGDYLRAEFFDPLGMKNTGVHDSALALEDEALGYLYEQKIVRAVNWEMSRVAAAGSLYSTVLDLNRWCDAVFAGKVISAASLETAVTVGVLDGDDPTYPELIGYGLGFELAELNGEQQIGHGGELDGFGSSLIRLPRHRLTVVLLHNCVPQLPGGHQWTLSRDIARLTLGDSLPEERPPQIDAGVPLSTLDEVVGRYDMGNNLVLTIARDGARLFGAVAGRPRSLHEAP